MLDPLSIVLNALTFGLLIAGVDGLGQKQDAAVAIGELVAGAAFGVVFVSTATRTIRAAAAGRPSEAADLRPVAGDVDLVVRRAEPRAGGAAVLLRGHARIDRRPMTGLLMTPWPLATALIAPISGRLADRFAPALLGGAGLLVMSLGLALVALQLGDPDATSSSPGCLRSAASVSASSSRRTTG